MSRTSFRLRRALGFVLFLVVGAYACHVGWAALADHPVTPAQDDWRVLDGLQRQPTVTWLLASQNGHRMPLALAVQLADYHLLSGSNHLPIVISVMAALAALGALRSCMVGGGGGRLQTSSSPGALFSWSGERT